MFDCDFGGQPISGLFNQTARTRVPLPNAAAADTTDNGVCVDDAFWHQLGCENAHIQAATLLGIGPRLQAH